MTKTGSPAKLVKSYSGFSVRFNANRMQPYTIWCGDETIGFAPTVEAAEKRIEDEINENRVKSRTRK